MLTGPALSNAAAAIVSVCRAGLDLDALRSAVLPRLRSVVPVDALWWAAADPATLLFTRARREGLPAGSGPYFIENEFLHDDVNRWTDLARSPAGVSTLMRATEAHPDRSDRYRDIFAPLGLQDELRAVLRVRGVAWGYLCLHREGAEANFSEAEAGFVQRLAPHLADALRTGLVRTAANRAPASGEAAPRPGLVLLHADGSLAGMNQAAEPWLEDLGGRSDGVDLPVEIRAVATGISHPEAALRLLPRLRVQTRSGRWAVLHASWMTSDADGTVAVIIENASAVEIAPTIMVAFGLTAREQQIAAYVCRGSSTREISTRLHLTVDTVQDHLKSVFDRTGVRSRGELVALIYRHDYLPQMASA
ncbi:MAG: helix-turn-helix transcriptional regulator [Actinomycetota bacterium]|nr:helix-turn-helix transcriptional regulator [Actinomycetota bacterium]